MVVYREEKSCIAIDAYSDSWKTTRGCQLAYIYIVLKLVEVTLISRGFMLVLYYVAQTMNGTMKMLKDDYVYWLILLFNKL